MKREGIICYFIKDNKILLLQVDYGNENGQKLYWSGVSGYIENGESPEDALMREVKEELGVSIKKYDIQFKGVVDISQNLKLHIFFIGDLEEKPVPRESSIKQLQWFAINQIPYTEMHPGTDSWLPDLLKQ